MTYGETIKDRRITLGLTLETVAKKAGTFKGYVSGIENGRVNPPAWLLNLEICKILKLDADYMLKLAHAQKAPKQVRGWFLKAVQG